MKENKYPYLNSPLRIGKTVFKNRLMAGPGEPVLSQSSETYPADALVVPFIERAKGGASCVVTIGVTAEIHTEHADMKQMGHQPRIDGSDPLVQHRFAEMAEMIRAEGAIPMLQCMPSREMIMDYDASDGIMSEYVEGDGSIPLPGREAPKELLYQVAEAYGEAGALAKSMSYQAVQVHMAYRHMFPARFFSRYTNKRTDEFGGSFENRVRFPLMCCEAIKKKAGKDMLLHVAVTMEEPKEIYGEEGMSIEEFLPFFKMADGIIDVISIRGHQIDLAQGLDFTGEVLPTRHCYHAAAKYIRENNLNIKLAYVCGAHDLDVCEDILRSGDADLILTTRAFITNPDLGIKMYEGRGDDVVPCLRCNKCHKFSPSKWASYCSVNPEYALSHRKESMVEAPKDKKKIAVVGGGPAGMKAAMDLYDRGHEVVIYEKEQTLGGQLNLAGLPKAKWPVAKFKEYLMHQVDKRNIEIHYGTEVKPGELDEQYDLIFVAIGAEPIHPPIPGTTSLMTYKEALENPEQVKGRAIFIGGGEVGLETSLYFAQERGNDVFVIEMQDKLAPEMAPVHYRRPYREMWESLPNYSWAVNATVVNVEDGKKVTYRDSDGVEHTVEGDTVILSAGTKARNDLAMSFGGFDKVRIVGDCYEQGSIATCMRTAHYAACNV